jgi:hypothetical protein
MSSDVASSRLSGSLFTPISSGAAAVDAGTSPRRGGGVLAPPWWRGRRGGRGGGVADAADVSEAVSTPLTENLSRGVATAQAGAEYRLSCLV